MGRSLKAQFFLCGLGQVTQALSKCFLLLKATSGVSHRARPCLYFFMFPTPYALGPGADRCGLSFSCHPLSNLRLLVLLSLLCTSYGSMGWVESGESDSGLVL